MALGKKVSFDYDGVLTTSKGADTFDRWKATGDEMYIITARQERLMGPVYAFASEHGITRSHVIRVPLGSKWEAVKRLGIDKHVDNNEDELDLIRKNTNALAWSINKL
jgi:uncharacterized HAD superfamily protein